MNPDEEDRVTDADLKEAQERWAAFAGEPAGGELFSAPVYGDGFRGDIPILADPKEGPVKNSADQRNRAIYALAYRGDSLPALAIPLGDEKTATKFFAWLRTGDEALAQFAIDGSTNPAGAHEDVTAFAAVLRQALAAVDPDEGIGPAILATGRALLRACVGEEVEGVVVSDQLPEGAEVEEEAKP